jgi:hypothetical protein
MDDDKLYKHHFSKEFSRILELCPKSQQKSSNAVFFQTFFFGDLFLLDTTPPEQNMRTQL